MFWSQHLGCWGQNTSRIQNKEVYATLCLQASPSFDDSRWQLVDAPHDMLIHQQLSPQAMEKMGYYFRNDGWYRKHFSLPADWNASTVHLYIEGSFHRSTVYLNGKLLGLHVQGYTAFSLRLDNVPGVQFGDSSKNVLAIYVDATRCVP